MDLIRDILDWFSREYIPKFRMGQEEHGGVLTDMGLDQSLNNMKAEIHDLVSYVYVTEKNIKAIKDLCESCVEIDTNKILAIINRVKED